MPPQQPKIDFIPDDENQIDFIPDEPEPSLLGKVWGAATNPLYKWLSPYTSEAAEGIKNLPPEAGAATVLQGLGMTHPMLANIAGLALRNRPQDIQRAGVFGTNLMGELGDQLTSPTTLAFGALGLGRNLAAKYAAPYVVKALQTGGTLPKSAQVAAGLGAATKVASAPFIGQGGYHLLRPGATPEERVTGGLEALGGIAGFRTPVNPFGTFERPRINPPEKFVGRGSTVPPVSGENLPVRANPPSEAISPEIVGPIAPTPIENLTGPGGFKLPSQLPTSITIKNPSASLNEWLRQKGYMPGGVGPDGYPKMILQSEITRLQQAQNQPTSTNIPTSTNLSKNELKAALEKIAAPQPGETSTGVGLGLVDKPVDENDPLWLKMQWENLRLKYSQLLSKGPVPQEFLNEMNRVRDKLEALQGTQTGISAVKPTNIRQVILSIPKTGNPEFDNLVQNLQGMENTLIRRARGEEDRLGFSDEEMDTYENLVGSVRRHPAMPPEIAAEWNRIGAENRARGPKFVPGQQVRVKSPDEEKVEWTPQVIEGGKSETKPTEPYDDLVARYKALKRRSGWDKTLTDTDRQTLADLEKQIQNNPEYLARQVMQSLGPKDVIPLKNEIEIKNPTKGAIGRLGRGGFTVVETKPDGTTIFRRIPKQEDIEPQERRVNEFGEEIGQTAIGVVDRGNVDVYNLEGRNPNYTSHDVEEQNGNLPRRGWHADRFRYSNGIIYWTGNPSPESYFKIEDEFASRGWPIKRHENAFTSQEIRPPKPSEPQERRVDVYGNEIDEILGKEKDENLSNAITQILTTPSYEKAGALVDAYSAIQQELNNLPISILQANPELEQYRQNVDELAMAARSRLYQLERQMMEMPESMKVPGTEQKPTTLDTSFSDKLGRMLIEADKTSFGYTGAAEYKEILNQAKSFGVDVDKIAGHSTRQKAELAIKKVKQIEKMNVKSGLPNIAMGGASERVLDVLGTSLYSESRPVVSVKELIQNSNDEHRISKVKYPIRIVMDESTENPLGERSQSISVRDFGRGMTPEQLYTKWSDVGETGKAEEELASGGFGFAKAAPLLGGNYSRTESIIRVGKNNVKYSFEGTPEQLKKQKIGVDMHSEITTEPTGIKITVWFPEDSYLWPARDMAANMGKWSKDMSNIQIFKTYGIPENYANEFLTNPTLNPVKFARDTGYEIEDIRPLPQMKLQETLTVPGANIQIRFDEPPAGQEIGGATLIYSNKGLYQGSTSAGFGMPISGAPDTILVDIEATVKEGTANYPFTANREQIARPVKAAIDEWIEKNIVSEGRKRRGKEIQDQYDAITTLFDQTRTNNATMFYDEGNRFDPVELDLFRESPDFQNATSIIENVFRELTSTADTLGWSRKPSERVKKFGILFQGSTANGTTLGIHIPNPNEPNSSAILVNLMEEMARANKTNSPRPLSRFATQLFVTLTHEIAHAPGGGHDKGHSYRHADLLSALDVDQTIDTLHSLMSAFGDLNNGQFNPEISELLSIYNQSRQRPARKTDVILATGTARGRQQNTTVGEGSNENGPPPNTESVASLARRFITEEEGASSLQTARNVNNFFRALLASHDVSFMLRQGIGMITRPEWWKAWGPAVKAIPSQQFFNGMVEGIKNDPTQLFTPRIDTRTGRTHKSFAEEAGLHLPGIFEASGHREEIIDAEWAEKIVPIKMSNRSYQASALYMRTQIFKSMVRDAVRAGYDVFGDMNQAKAIADYININTGYGSLGKLERYGKILGDIFFAPHLIASRLKMLNPMTYIMASKVVRKEYLRSLFGIAGFGLGVINLAKLMGAEVNTDPFNADFGKIRIGNTRLDPWGGHQQYVVLAARLLMGKTTSSTSGKTRELGVGYGSQTRKDVIQNFAANKTTPIIKFVYDWASANSYRPIYMGDKITQMFIPMAIQDVIELSKEDPNLLYLTPLIMSGMGAQTYDRGIQPPKFIPEEMDIRIPPR